MASHSANITPPDFATLIESLDFGLDLSRLIASRGRRERPFEFHPTREEEQKRPDADQWRPPTGGPVKAKPPPAGRPCGRRLDRPGGQRRGLGVRAAQRHARAGHWQSGAAAGERRGVSLSGVGRGARRLWQGLRRA
jgi:hypothetical protein